MNFRKTTLPNGLRVITVPRASDPAATVLVLVEAGSKYETKEINGLSHFLEHMCFKGTTTRPTALQISSELDSLGAHYNAFTSQEYTGYYAKVQAKHAARAIDIVSDLSLNPLFAAPEVEKEKGVICEEINMYEDQPQRKVQDLIMELVYGDQPAGWSIAGEKGIVRTMTRDHFLDYRAAHYVASSTIVAVAGKFDEKKVITQIGRAFRNMSRDPKSPKLPVREAQSAPGLLVREKESDQTHLVFGIRAFDVHHKDHDALEVLAAILGGSMSSRLFQRIRESLGAAYYVHASQDAYTDHGLLTISMGVDHAKLLAVIPAALEECARLADERVPAKELQTVKDSLIGTLFLSLETSDALANFYGGQEVLRRPLRAPEAIARAVQKVSAGDVLRVAKAIFRNDRLNCALIGPAKERDIAPRLTIE